MYVFFNGPIDSHSLFSILYYDVAIAHLHRAKTQHDNHEVYALMQHRQSEEKFIMLMLIDRWQVEGEENVGWKEICRRKNCLRRF